MCKPETSTLERGAVVLYTEKTEQEQNKLKS